MLMLHASTCNKTGTKLMCSSSGSLIAGISDAFVFLFLPFQFPFADPVSHFRACESKGWERRREEANESTRLSPLSRKRQT
jgi:hypothetical protein